MSGKLTEDGLRKRRERDRARSKTPERLRWRMNRDLMKSYGITLEDYERLSKEQGHVCAICGCAQIPSRVCKRLVVDHCHQSGKVRGLLCSFCNPMLGYARDNVDILKQGIEYLVVPQFSK